MTVQQQPPAAIMQPSPADTLMSAPDEAYPSLFDSAASPPASPSDTTTHSFSSDRGTPSRLSAVPEEADTPSGDKKTTKKRKSWGQVLPEPKTNLPPRKRAKTDDEKEQRRVERVLRNRRAAQSSRERKRQEVEALEKRNQELEELLASVQKTNMALVEELRQHRGSSIHAGASSPLNHTLSSQLFGPSGADSTLDADHLTKLSPTAATTTTTTINPASLSPPPTGHIVHESTKERPTSSQAATTVAAAASDLTQRPAVMLCDLQCQTEMVPATVSSSPWARISFLVMIASATVAACQRPLLQIAVSLKASISLRPNPQLLATIMWLVTHRPPSTENSTSATGSARNPPTSPQTSSQPVTTLPLTSSVSNWKASTLRVRLLRKILSSSPNLARPLWDATFVALRLVSEGLDTGAEASFEPAESRDVDQLTDCLRRTDLPSREGLLALLWTLKLEQDKQAKGAGSHPRADSGRGDFARFGRGHSQFGLGGRETMSAS